jgi:hypothetical protein
MRASYTSPRISRCISRIGFKDKKYNASIAETAMFVVTRLFVIAE